MQLNADTCYRAILARDARFDGRFFVGVRSTGVYCRPVCRVRMPRAENCRYFASAAAAEQGGFRPCLRCRPELAPGRSGIDASSRLAQAGAALIDAGEFDRHGMAGLANRIGTTDRHLRRIFAAEFGVTPVAYAQTRRLLLAKQLLTDTGMTVTDIAYASGFQSVRRFNALFAQRYRLSPSRLRNAAGNTPADRLNFRLGYRPPLDWEHLTGFLGARTIEGVEEVVQQRYRRTLRVFDGKAVHLGWLVLRDLPRSSAIGVELSIELSSVVPQVLQTIRRALDLDADPAEIATALGALANGHEGVRLPGSYDGFELAVRAVLGQQITVKAARTLAGRFAARFGEGIVTPFPDLKTVFPTPAVVAALTVDDIASLGIIAARARCIIGLARAIDTGVLVLAPGATDPQAMIEVMLDLPGIGDWTAQYIAMRALRWPDAFPAADYGVMKALDVKTARLALAAAQGWQPWRAYAVMHLWRGLA